MSNRQDNRVCARRGVAFVITLIFLSLFACLAVAIAATADSNLTIARNRIEGQQASAFAATGIQMMQASLGGMPAGGAVNASHMNNLICAHLISKMVPGWTASTIFALPNHAGVILPTITLTSADGRTGTVVVTIQATSDGKTVKVTAVAHYPHYKEIVDGGSNQDTAAYQNCGWCVAHDPLYHVNSQYPTAPVAQRIARYEMGVRGGHMPLFGLASLGTIYVHGNPDIHGDVLSAYYSPLPPEKLTPAVRVQGAKARVDGNVTVVEQEVANQSELIAVTNAANITGARVTGAAKPEWPEVDITPFKNYVLATSEGWEVYPKDGSSFSNIRIPPSTDPKLVTTISNKDIKGVVYIQSPNKVTFKDCTITGVIVADPPAENDLTANQIIFNGVTTSGVENLLEAKYDGLHTLTGSFLLAPGFSTEFTGDFGTVNGCVIASEITFKQGNAKGTFNGGVVNLSGSSIEIKGNEDLTFNHGGDEAEPAGIGRLMCVRGKYVEQE